MNKRILGFIAAVMLLTACSEADNTDLTDPLESGRGFIDATLKGDYKKAEHHLLPDSTNLEYLQGLRDFNKNSTKLERQNYSEANIIIDSVKDVSDSVSIIYYANTYKREPTKIKMVKKEGNWLVDFKFTFNENDQPVMP